MSEITLPNGVTLAYDDLGDPRQRAIVLIHGVSMSRRYFHKQLKPLSARHRVIAVDLRGHGDSEKVAHGHTIPQYARDLDLFLRALELERPVLLGWSMGGFVAWDYIKQFGTAGISGLVISDEGPSDFKWDGYAHGFVDLAALHGLMSDLQADQRGLFTGLVPEMFHGAPTDADAAWMVEECLKLPIGCASAILFDQSVQDYRELITTIDIPTLVCWGRHDALLPVSGASYVQEQIAGAQLRVFEQSGHCPFIEESDAFNRVVDEFVASLPGSTLGGGS